MKKVLITLSVFILSISVLCGMPWAQCPDDPFDNGECDSLNVICLDCDKQEGEVGPWSIRFPLLVSHDQTDPIDSIIGFTIPLAYTHTNPSAYCSVSAYWNATSMLYLYPDFSRSIYRHMFETDYVPTLDTLYANRMALLDGDFSFRGWDYTILTLDDAANFWFIVVPTGSQDQRWWEGDRVLLATMTLRIQDTMHVCVDTTYWPPISSFRYYRSDNEQYIPRHNLPHCFWVGPQPLKFTIEAAPDTQIIKAGESTEYIVTLTSLSGFESPCTLDVSGLPAGASAGFSINPLIPTNSSIMTISTGLNTIPGTYDLTITASELSKLNFQDSIQVVLSVMPDSIPFASAVNYATSDGPYSVFCADLDGDTDLDLAVTNIYSNDVSILNNNGNGTFQTNVDYGAGNFARSVFCADLDADGDLDLAIANSESHNVSILRNEGDATFQPKVDYATGENPISVFCADLDGDLDIDLVVPNGNSDNISILKNNGDGTFQTKIDYVVGDWPHFIFCADLDGDADVDLAVANRGDDDVSILKNNGNGTFQAAVDYDVGDEPWSVFCADLDGDSDLDLAVANSGSDDVSVLKNNGNGTFQARVDYDVGDRPYSVFCADLNGDNYLDLVTANSLSMSVSISQNNGDGTFQIKVDYKVGSEPHTVFCADLDGDTDLDMAVANTSSDSVSVLLNLTQLPGNLAPYPFSLLSPADQDTSFGKTIFRWQIPYDPNFGDQMRYELHVSTSFGFEPENTTIDSNLVLSKLTKVLDENTYYWKVKAKDNWGAETWSTETWSLEVTSLEDTLYITAYSPVDIIVIDPVGDSISLETNTIFEATYDTTEDFNQDGDKDDRVTIPHPFVGDYQVRVVSEPDADPEDSYSLGVRINGSTESTTDLTSVPPPEQPDIITYECLSTLKGDVNQDGTIALADAILLLNYLFKGGLPPDPLELADLNCDGKVDLSDVIYLLNYLFKGGKPPCS